MKGKRLIHRKRILAAALALALTLTCTGVPGSYARAEEGGAPAQTEEDASTGGSGNGPEREPGNTVPGTEEPGEPVTPGGPEESEEPSDGAEEETGGPGKEEDGQKDQESQEMQSPEVQNAPGGVYIKRQ